MGVRRIVIAVDLDYFFAQCEEIRNPEIKGKPVVICVFSGRTETSGVVSTANYVAREFGVRSGVTIANAKKILKENKEALFLSVDHDYYGSISERVMQIIRSHSLAFEQVSIDEAFIDVTETSQGDYSRAGLIGKQIKVGILREEKLTCSVGVGPNKLIAKMAADKGKPNGFTNVSDAQVELFLRDLPLRRLIGIGPKVEAKMEALGIKSIHDLAQSQVQLLSDQFGKNLGPEFKRLAQGIDEDPVQERSIEQLSRIITLKKDTNDFSFEDEIKPLALDISQRLTRMDLKCKVIGIMAISTDLKTRSKARTLGEFTTAYETIMSFSRELFKELFQSSEGLEVRRVGIRVSGLESRKPKGEEDQQESLINFLPHSPSLSH